MSRFRSGLSPSRGGRRGKLKPDLSEEEMEEVRAAATARCAAKDPRLPGAVRARTPPAGSWAAAPLAAPPAAPPRPLVTPAWRAGWRPTRGDERCAGAARGAAGGRSRGGRIGSRNALLLPAARLPSVPSPPHPLAHPRAPAAQIREAFNLFDTEGKGTIDIRELKAGFRALGFVVKKAEIRAMLVDIDKEMAATVDFNEFVDMVTPKMQSRDTREEIMKVFNLFDDDNSGYITFRNLKRVAMELGENLTDDELQEMVDEADRDGDGMISSEEFYRVMKKRGDSALDDLDSDDED